MYAMHYEITLPADYDMGIIRTRVATRGSATDQFPGLGLKAYLIRERGKDSSPANQYAPFYLWASLEGMNRFLWGDGFRALRDSFGRPVVQHWIGMAFRLGGTGLADVRAATKTVEPLPDGMELSQAIEHARAQWTQRSRGFGVAATAFAIDPRHWEVVHFTLWKHPPEQEPGIRYQVLHLSSPHLDDLRNADGIGAAA